MNAKAVISEENDIPTPRETADLFGHEEAEQVLINAEASGRLPHAWLITGPKGIGKARLQICTVSLHTRQRWRDRVSGWWSVCG